MKIGIISDTHRNVDLIEKAVDWLIKKQKITMLYHLGDDYDDVSVLQEKYLETVQVPGIYDERYKNGSLPSLLTEMVCGLTVTLVHSLEKDLTRENIERSDIILFGHTHRAELKLDNGRLYMNPGHLKGPLDKNMPPSFGALSIEDKGIHAAIFDMKGKAMHSMELVRSGSGLYKT
ncbi:MAG: metallophosphoesterase family protein [Chitinispirillaceae bacterium]|nr:metallophosphoesterase family protein [Chitinispirillaceae bacterium]